MSHNLKRNAERMKDDIEYKVLELHDYLLEEIAKLQEKVGAQDHIILGQKEIIQKYKALLDGKRRAA